MKNPIISLGADHGAFELREALLAYFKSQNIEVIDHGTLTKSSVDYPDYAAKVATDVQSGAADFGVLCCTTGIGMSISANKFAGIRAALVHFDEEAQLTRRHNNTNVLCFGQLYTTPHMACRMVDLFLTAEFEGGRHQRRVDKMSALESQSSPVKSCCS
ncbi:MAG: ribose 5-phosphate isomerase B [Verrucomicrobia bacterium]|nr:ribose 5-phosphate isomerase B [Verrucomicrobiota bacterium]